jgi:hypothetical protein
MHAHFPGCVRERKQTPFGCIIQGSNNHECKNKKAALFVAVAAKWVGCLLEAPTKRSRYEGRKRKGMETYQL